MSRLLKLAVLLLCVGMNAPVFATTHFVRPDGGTLYTANVLTGQCDGEADVAYPGTGTDQHCAVNDFRYAWDDDSGVVGSGSWALSNTVGGDTWVIRGCEALAGQMNPANPDCRIGWDKSTGSGPDSLWCYGVGSYTCYNPPIPAGTSGAHTRILGGCAYDGSCNSGNITTRANLTQLFGGFSLTWTFNLGSTQYVDIAGIELTTHNGACSHRGSPEYPTGCSTSQPLSDYADNGFLTNNTTANVTFTDVYVDGFESSGINGPIGGAITMTRVNVNFNIFAGWNFDDGGDTPDAAGSSITASYVTMEGNGCKQQYPITDAAWPALACWDPNSGGFGDSWSGQDTELDSFTCDHCAQMYNTKDGFIGPHTQIGALSVTNSVSIGNMGAQWKWGQAPNGTILFQNNLTVCNPYRQEEILPGAAQNFNISTGLGGSYLSDFGRGNGCFSNLQRSGSVNNFYGDSVIGAQSIAYQLQCGYYSTGNVFNQETNCGSVPNTFKDNNFLGYTDPNIGEATALYYALDAYSVFTGSYNDEYGWKSGTTDTCGSTGNICVDPLLVSEPAQAWPGTETDLDVFNPFVDNNSFYPTGSSPLIGAGAEISGLTTDYYGVDRPNLPTMGGVEPAETPASTPTFSPVAGSYGPAQTVTISTTSAGAIICYNTTGSPATNGTTGCTTGSLYTAPVTVSASETLYAVAGGTGWLDSSIGSAAYIINGTAATPTFSPVAGTYAGTQTVTIFTSTGGATLCYTTDGSTPLATTAGTCSHGTTYSTPVSVASSLTLKAIATESGFTNSGVGTAAYTITPSGGTSFGGNITFGGSAVIQ